MVGELFIHKLEKMRKIILSMMIGLLLTACDPVTSYYFYVRNDCTTPINVIATKKYPDYHLGETITTSILPNENKLIYNYSTLARSPELDCVQESFSTITIIMETDTSKRDFTNSFFWEMTSVKKGLNYEASYNLTISSGDFEK